MPRKLGECSFPGCHEPRAPGRFYCAACHKAKYECQLDDCTRPHYSNGLCHPHYCQENGLFMTADGKPADIVGAAAYTQRRINQEMENIIKLLRWEAQQDREEE